MGPIRAFDVGYFVAELGVYAAVVWWAFTRDVPSPARWAIAVTGVVVLAASWGAFASPKAPYSLPGWWDTLFRCVWFGLGAAAAVTVFVQALSRTG